MLLHVFERVQSFGKKSEDGFRRHVPFERRDVNLHSSPAGPLRFKGLTLGQKTPDFAADRVCAEDKLNFCFMLALKKKV